MELTTKVVNGVAVAELSGDIDGSTAPAAQRGVLAASQGATKLLLDLTNVPFMSSAGLRMLLSTYRQVTGNGGKIVLVGVREDILDTMTVTGFLRFFTVCDSVDAGLQTLNQPE